MLELSNNSYYVRRRPTTYPLRFVPSDSFTVVDDNGISFWDQRTIYVEPHTRDLCKTPARVAQWLKAHGQLRDKWLPIQAVPTLFNSCAFVVLSGNVMHEQIWERWRGLDKPECWKVMTKSEHTKRTNEYLVELKKAKPWLKIKDVEMTQVDKPLSPNTDPPIEAAALAPPATSKRKRKRKKNKADKPTNEQDIVSTNQVGAEEDNAHTTAIDDKGSDRQVDELAHAPSNKRLKFCD